MKREYKKLIIEGIIFLLILIITILIFYSSQKIIITLPFDTSEFRVYGLSNVVLGDFQLYYNFDKQIGTINFQIRKDRKDQIDHIDILLPQKKVKISDIIVYNETRILDLGIDYKINYDNLSMVTDSIKLNNFKDDLSYYTINISFISYNSILYPNGRFIIETDPRIVYYKKGSFGEFDKGSILEFDLGKFQCLTPCFSELVSYHPDESVTPQQIDNIFRIYATNEINSKAVKFVLNTYDRNKKWWKEFQQNIGVGLLVSLIALLCSIITRVFLLSTKRNFYLNIESMKYHHFKCSYRNNRMTEVRSTIPKIERRGYRYCKNCIHEFRR